MGIFKTYLMISCDPSGEEKKVIKENDIVIIN